MEVDNNKDEQEEESSPKAWGALTELLHPSADGRGKTHGTGLELSKAAWSAPHITTSPTKKRQWVIAAGDSLLRGRGVLLLTQSTLEASLLLTGGSYQGCHQKTAKPCTA